MWKTLLAVVDEPLNCPMKDGCPRSPWLSIQTFFDTAAALSVRLRRWTGGQATLVEGVHRMTRIRTFLLLFLVVAFALAAQIRAADEESAMTAQRIDALVKQLGDEELSVREAATEALIRGGVSVVPTVAKAVDNPDREISRRAALVLKGIERKIAGILRAKGADVQTNDQGWIRHVSFEGAGIENEDLAVLPALTRIENLYVVHETRLTDDALRHAASLTTLRRLMLDRTPISDEALRYFRNLVSLEYLELGSTAVSGAGLAHLTNATKLTSLGLSGTRIDDKNLEFVAKLNSLTSLSISKTRVNGSGLRKLRGLRHLAYLRLDDTRIGDATLATVADFESIRNLNLDRTNIKDAALRHLARSRSIRLLRLANTNVSSQGVEGLAKSIPLKYLDISETLVTKAEIESIRRKFPRMQIHWSPARPKKVDM